MERAVEAGTPNGSEIATALGKRQCDNITSDDRGQDNLACALAHAQAGRPVFPCRPDNKRPLTDQGFKDATYDPAQIRRWWAKWPNAMPGLPTGRASGLAVLDLDRKDGKDGIAELRALGFDPDTLTPCNVETMSGGKHLYFRWPEGLACSASKMAPGIDDAGKAATVPDRRQTTWNRINHAIRSIPNGSFRRPPWAGRTDPEKRRDAKFSKIDLVQSTGSRFRSTSKMLHK